jgi:hypothetical protein
MGRLRHGSVALGLATWLALRVGGIMGGGIGVTSFDASEYPANAPIEDRHLVVQGGEAGEGKVIAAVIDGHGEESGVITQKKSFRLCGENCRTMLSDVVFLLWLPVIG